MTERWSIAPLKPGEEAEWCQFLEQAENETLFHDLRFLAYHPQGRFRLHHLMVREEGRLSAVLPGGFAGDSDRPLFSSPLGASVGGPAFSRKLGAKRILDMVEALRTHAAREGWHGMELTLPPAAYHSRGSDSLSFALFCNGFRLAHRFLCQMIPISPGPGEQYTTLFRDTAANLVRAGRRKGVTTVEGGAERLNEFLPLFEETYRRHGTSATHTPDELADLLKRVPDRVRLHLAMAEGVPIAGVLLFLLNVRVAYTFYICMSDAHTKLNGNVVLFAALLDSLAERGFRWLDLGPSASDTTQNAGAMFFKEGLGSKGYCRDRWTYAAAPAGNGA